MIVVAVVLACFYLSHAQQLLSPMNPMMQSGQFMPGISGWGAGPQTGGILIPPIIFPPQPVMMGMLPSQPQVSQAIPQTSGQIMGAARMGPLNIIGIPQVSQQGWPVTQGLADASGNQPSSSDPQALQVSVDDIKRIQSLGQQIVNAKARKNMGDSPDAASLTAVPQNMPSANTIIGPGPPTGSLQGQQSLTFLPPGFGQTSNNPVVPNMVNQWQTSGLVSPVGPWTTNQPMSGASNLLNVLQQRRKRDFNYDALSAQQPQVPGANPLAGLSQEAIQRLLPLLNLIYQQRYRQVQALPFINTVQKLQVVPQQERLQELVKVPTVSYAQGCKPETYQYQTTGVGIEPTLQTVNKLVSTPVSYNYRVLKPEINSYQESVLQPEIVNKLINYYKLQQTVQQVPGYKILPVEQRTVGLSLVPQTQTLNTLQPYLQQYQVKGVGYVPYNYQAKSLSPVITTEQRQGVQVVPEIYKRYGVNVNPFFYSVAAQPQILNVPPIG